MKQFLISGDSRITEYEKNLSGESKNKFFLLFYYLSALSGVTRTCVLFGFLERTVSLCWYIFFCHKLAGFVFLSHHSLGLAVKCSPRPGAL